MQLIPISRSSITWTFYLMPLISGHNVCGTTQFVLYGFDLTLDVDKFLLAFEKCVLILD